MNRILHIMLRVSDIEKSVEFYTNILGMKILRTFDRPEEGYSLTFLGYAEESNSCVIELTYNYGKHRYDIGNGFGHFAIGVSDCYEACAQINELGGTVVREAGPLAGSFETIAFIEDPDGYKIELIER
ncbi:lactoylglutathione lyase [Aliikangiella coralliicola]|uniref:Lactoylglutathione lyase n=1 Tax=Aliikangiella coralliicola TaxID=2592383 RepID=A0A545UCI6_9GAMM|nr:lactoylglutathione lyase [Aliikangiella coralliicola]TQV87179.1 lactoylglutathione lyase [Aliikangiella coralliicola]